MKKSEYKNAMRTIRRARDYGAGNFSHPLSPSIEYVQLAKAALKKMNPDLWKGVCIKNL